jgi:hypothetical protein
MPARSRSRAARAAPGRRRKGRRSSGWIATVRRRVRSVRRAVRRMRRAMRTAPLGVRVIIGVVVLLIVWASANWVYQTARKPTEMFFPADHTLTKTPFETWRQYGPLFTEHSTAVVTPELLAALAQVEGGGNPVARTYWRWSLTWNPFELYQPASSSVGMYQITDATFREAKHYCIHDHVVVEDGSWNNVESCWFNSFYSRVIPSHAIELTAAFLDRGVEKVMKHRQIAATLQQKQDLAAVIHLCGTGAGAPYAARGFRLIAHQRCGDHDVHDYLAQVNAMKRQFGRLAATDFDR